MVGVAPSALPQNALLQKYVRDGAYTDCYAADIDRAVSHAQYVEAFYTTAVFKLERLILKWAISRPSTDDDARRLAAEALDRFAAWHVEARAENQLLLCDIYGRTRSWLMSAPAGEALTRLYFGSAVVPRKGRATLGLDFRALLALHRLYSKVLLHAAKSRLQTP